MLVEWRPEAREALFEILDYIAGKNFYAALQLGEEIEHATSCLPEHPYCTAVAEYPEHGK